MELTWSWLYGSSQGQECTSCGVRHSPGPMDWFDTNVCRANQDEDFRIKHGRPS